MKKRILILPLLAMMLSSCGDKTPAFETSFEEFKFSLKWGVQLDASYNSDTKQLVKFTHVRERQPEDYITIYNYPYLKEVYDSVKEMNPYTYADDYNPFAKKNHIMSTPSMHYILTIGDKSIEIKDYPISKDTSQLSNKGKKLMTLIFSITDTIQDSNEWKNLPDFEYYYK